MFLTDLTFIEDGNADRVKAMPHLINFDKRTKTAEKIKEIQQHQNSYPLMEIPELQNFLTNNLKNADRDPEQMYQKSLQLEPREREDEKIARLLQESGFL
jgi:son of sevenless-like protein